MLLKERYITAMVNKANFAALVTGLLFAVGGITAHSAAAETVGPLSPVDQISLSPVSQQSAVRSAQDYLEMSGFSRSGLIDQLVIGSGFSTADATYAVDSLAVDWNKQAVRSAESYLEMSGFSRSGLIDQLVIGSGFTPAQAAYGVSAVGL
jgi:peptidoglycan hydrolase-like protein with peptidoglycan-binding domain